MNPDTGQSPASQDIETLRRACEASARADYARRSRAICEADRASLELAATIRECAIVLMGCAADISRAAGRAGSCDQGTKEATLDELMALLPPPNSNGPPINRLSHHAILALTAARETRDVDAIRISETLAYLAALGIVRSMAQQ